MANTAAIDMVARVKRDEGGGAYFAAPKTSINFIRTGCKLLDLAMGGGWAEGRVGNIVGDKSTGKTLLCIEAAANFHIQHPKSKIYYRESEYAFDEPYAKAIGMPMDALDLKHIRTVEELNADLTDVIAKTKGKPALYAVDSLDALSDAAELERELGDATYGAGKAKLMSEMFRRKIGSLEKSSITTIFVSQIRDNIGAKFGRKTKRSGGKALDFYASQVLWLAQLGVEDRTISGVKRPVSINIKAKLDKNKVGLPFREAQFEIVFGYGIDDLVASMMWLKETKYLKDVTGLPSTSTTDAIKKWAAINHDKVTEINTAVEEIWYQIEKSFLPTRSKYT